MDKIICDICGTTYPSSEECCPICGCTNAAAEELLNDAALFEDAAEETVSETGNKKAIFDFDEVNPEEEPDDVDVVEDFDADILPDDTDVIDDAAVTAVVDALVDDDAAEDDEADDEDDDDAEEDDDEEDDDEEDEDEGDEPRHNTFVVILLTVIIVALLGAAGFIFVRYFLPNMGEETVPTTAVQEVETTEATTAPTIPCQQMAMTNAGIAELSAEGQQFLLHVKALPENTTDKIVYTSADESIATVTEDGKITAVSEGETVIHITCGKTSMTCPVIVKFVEETVPATTEATVEETKAEETAATEAAEETKPAEESKPAAEGLKDVKLKLKRSDIQLGVYYSFRLELDCDLDPSEVTWTSEHPHIAKVDETGSVTAVKSGTTSVTAKYGDQEVKCMVRCVWY